MSHGGLTLAKYLRKRDKNIEIIIVEKQEYISYSQCAMPYYISGEVSEEDIVFNSAQDLKDKSANVIAVVRNQELTIEALDNEIKRLQAMKDSIKKKLDKFKTYIKSSMLVNNIEKIETPLGAIKFTKSASTEIYDESLIDKKFRILLSDNQKQTYRIYSKKYETKMLNELNEKIKLEQLEGKQKDSLENEYKNKIYSYKLYLRLLIVTDYISGMTDTYMKSTYQELMGIK